MCKPELTYNVRVTSIWGWYMIRKTPYYSVEKLLFSLKQRLLLNETLKGRYLSGSIMFDLIHFEDGKKIAKQTINLNIK